MATFNLTPGGDTFTGGAANDVFTGFGGGDDRLRGGAGIDYFYIQNGQQGLLDGGLGVDRIYLNGHNNHTFATALTIVNVEQLIVENTNLYATATQLKGFTKILSTASSTEFTINLQSGGGILDFSTSYTDSQLLTINAEFSTSAVTTTGSARNDEFFGSEFNDRFNGGGGNDIVRGFLGTDILNGGLGKDFLEGDSGNDVFLFDTALWPSNVDHIMDFRGVDDTVRLDDSVFAALPTGGLANAFFKDLGLAKQDADDVILYNSLKGFLYYDDDGLGGDNPVLFAILDNFAGDIPTLLRSDIVVV